MILIFLLVYEDCEFGINGTCESWNKFELIDDKIKVNRIEIEFIVSLLAYI